MEIVLPRWLDVGGTDQAPMGAEAERPAAAARGLPKKTAARTSARAPGLCVTGKIRRFRPSLPEERGRMSR